MTLPADIVAIGAARHYFQHMLSQCLRMLALMALVLMPFMMASAPAEAHGKHGGLRSASGENHCGDQQQPEAPPATDMAQCMLMCAALPAAPPSQVGGRDLPCAPLVLAAVAPIHGIILEIATPPPRTA